MIGELNEKTIHKSLKTRIEPDVACHEVKLNGYYVDVLRDEVVFEIQSRNLYVIKEKLRSLLGTHRVTVVYPVIRTKWIVWVDEVGQVVRRRKSPKSGQVCHVLAELYGIRDLLDHENLSFRVDCLDAEDFRLVRGKAETVKRLECVPLTWLDVVEFGGTRERGLERVLPELVDEFTSKEFGRMGGLQQNLASKALKVLRDSGVIEQVGKRGRLYLYRRIQKSL
ncbi:MAG: hypothetical protein FWG40_05100 [Peptococcaceae bacterium]|nr:hypothetical protein [Peptococcaceae bacterium]